MGDRGQRRAEWASPMFSSLMGGLNVLRSSENRGKRTLAPGKGGGGVTVTFGRSHFSFRTKRREWIVILGLAFFLFFLSFPFAILTLGALMIPVYATMLVVLDVWNGWAVLDLARASWEARRHPRALAVHVGLLAPALLAVAGWLSPPDIFNRPKTPVAGAALFALIYSIAQVVFTGRRTHRDFFAPVYNLFNLVFLSAWVTAEGSTGSDPGPLTYAFAHSVGLFQMLNISFVAGWGPFFVLPSYLPKLKGLRWSPGTPQGRGFGFLLRRLPPTLQGGVRKAAWGISKASGGLVIYATVALLLLFPLAVGSTGSFYAIDPTTLPHHPTLGVHFAATGGAFTGVTRAPPNWRDLVAREVTDARALGLDYVRYDLQVELLQDASSLGALDEALCAVRAGGLDVILSPYGSSGWAGSHPSFEELNRTIAEEAVFLAERYQPAYLFPFYEPNGQVAINLGHGMPTATWVGAIEDVAERIKDASPSTRVLIEVSDGPQGPELFASLMATPAPIDAVGFDLYPGGADDLSKVDVYADIARTNPSRQFWISEFGLDTIQYGEVAQARILAKLLSQGSTRWNVTGYCVWGLEDNTGIGLDKTLLVGLGITTLEGRRKAAFDTYRDYITALRSGP